MYYHEILAQGAQRVSDAADGLVNSINSLDGTVNSFKDEMDLHYGGSNVVKRFHGLLVDIDDDVRDLKNEVGDADFDTDDLAGALSSMDASISSSLATLKQTFDSVVY